MLPAQIVHHGLWLGPSSAALLPCITSSLIRRPRKGSSQVGHGYRRLSAYSFTHRTQYPILTYRTYHVASKAFRTPAWTPRPLDSSHSQDNALLFEELKRLSLKGSYVRVQKLVDKLVRERDQKPSIRMFDALILANVDPRHGSSAEVAYLLQEMTDEGIVPDAATYHSILKVCRDDPTYTAAKISKRSSLSIRITF